ncbi:programmed cell death 2 like trus [Oratosquilla oratoria]|uniref:programmed cell death 2 like trus n=1 Tax=Oratosquilla oratoria TaxID=337810 RepID=UPI003F76927C
MAYKSNSYLLGYVDEQINSHNRHLVNYTTNKIGGLPDWCSGTCKIPSCVRCGRTQSLVAQIYAPLQGSPYHRTLYFFACVTRECWNRPVSWTCLRSQVLDQDAMPTSPATTSPPTTANSSKSKGESSWFEDDDDWGGGGGGGKDDWSGGNNNDGNGNNSSNTIYSTPSSSSSQLYLDNLNKSAPNLNNLNANNTAVLQDVTRSFDRQLNLNEGDNNANEALRGAVGVVPPGCEMGEASALIEGPEEDMIAVDTPEKPTTDIPALFQEGVHIDANIDVTLVPFFLASDDEPEETTEFSEHERELLLQYTQSKGHEFKEEDLDGAQAKGDGVYEKDVTHHGDALLHKFKKRISRSPQQVLRYCREEGALPLWLYPPTQQDHLQKCCHCSGPLAFEMQLTPQLVLFLRVEGVIGTPLEFGTVVLLSCVRSCWAEGDTFRREALVVQHEVV